MGFKLLLYSGINSYNVMRNCITMWLLRHACKILFNIKKENNAVDELEAWYAHVY